MRHFFVIITLLPFIINGSFVSVLGQGSTSNSTLPNAGGNVPTTPKPTALPQSIQTIVQSLQKRLDLINTTLVSLSKTFGSMNLVNISNKIANNTKQITGLTSNTSRRLAQFQDQIRNFTGRLDLLEGSTSGSAFPTDDRVTRLEENVANITVQIGAILANRTMANTGNNGTWVHNYSYWVGPLPGGKGSNYGGNRSPSCNCNCGKKNKFIFG